MGVLLFIMVMGKFPHGTKVLTDKYYSLIKTKDYEGYFKAVEATKASSAFRELIVGLLAYQPSERPTIPQIRASRFLNEPSYNP